MKPLTEAQFQRQVTDLCDVLRLKWHHETDSRRTNPGWPDLTIVGPGGIVFLELKSAKGRVSKDQQEWIDALNAAGQRAYIARPADLPILTKLLTTLARGVPSSHATGLH